MANTYTKLNIHIVFHVKSTGVCIKNEDLPIVFAYIGGIVRNVDGYPLTVGGIENHIHILATIPKTMSVSEFVQKVKANSSRWIKTLDKYYESFAWQEGYGAFCVSPSLLKKTIHYIETQEEHHHKESVRAEFIRFLQENGIEFDERYLL
ncbi:MAG: transposase [Bacteroidales bacterium]|jgi:REP element-mobilizing transposase RayT|nr:transposase [Bacteroidales bacterium]